ncbi:hypothetical protein F511_31736 [Dorcoceras hygrometricum]|uniref:Secreted protein n=1 Tax=Dorcoceras hygrometricum TaxID=472368 RepID=A0A2Z7B3Q9_9LAMI|nr:hypothetical protein F511_31736 [Dorcoceras hygrometricum]
MDNTRLLLVILCFSCILGLRGAIPSTRTGNLVQKSHSCGSVADVESKGDMWELIKRKKRRVMEIEVNDYPGSGANNRHTPRTQLDQRGCFDC